MITRCATASRELQNVQRRSCVEDGSCGACNTIAVPSIVARPRSKAGQRRINTMCPLKIRGTTTAAFLATSASNTTLTQRGPMLDQPQGSLAQGLANQLQHPKLNSKETQHTFRKHLTALGVLVAAVGCEANGELPAQPDESKETAVSGQALSVTIGTCPTLTVSGPTLQQTSITSFSQWNNLAVTLTA